MAALTTAKPVRRESKRYQRFVLKTGDKVFRGSTACIDTAGTTIVVTKGAVVATLVPIGIFAEDVDDSGSAGGKLANVRLFNELETTWFDNDPGAGAVTAANFGEECFMLDDHSASMTATGASKLGRVMNVDSVLGVEVAPLGSLTG